jgi:ferritin
MIMNGLKARSLLPLADAALPLLLVNSQNDQKSKKEKHKMKDIMQEAMNVQIQAEIYSSYLYLSMSAYYESLNLPGFASWMRLQAEEENMHAMKFFDHIVDRGGRVKLLAIDAPPVDFESPRAAFKMAYEHETEVTARIHNLYKLAVEHSDFPAQSLLNWFVDEQVEEEKNTLAVVEQLEMIGDQKMGLFMVDRELGRRRPEATSEEAPA